MNIWSIGTIGSMPAECESGFCYFSPEPTSDMAALRINWQPSLEFPGGSKLNYLYVGAPMFGCVRGVDTLVSTGYFVWYGFPGELNAFDRITESSSRLPSPHFSPDAVADQEYTCVYTDTALASVGFLTQVQDHIEGRLHKPIGLSVRQTSYAWSAGNATRFIIFDLWFKNISNAPIQKGAIGINIDPDARHHEFPSGYNPHAEMLYMSGFVATVPIVLPTHDTIADTIDMIWASHPTGDPGPSGFGSYSPTSAMGVRVLRAPPSQVSFNWWGAYTEAEGFPGTWGPWRVSNILDYAARQGAPLGDRALYQMMTNGEIDYDQMYSAIDQLAAGWSRPPTSAAKALGLATGQYKHTLHLSYGPLPDIAPGDSVPFTYAIFAGENFHTTPDNYARNFNPQNPESYRANLDFSDLIVSARAADWYFDNPGVDTDNDGYAGKFYLTNCVGSGLTDCDTVWYKGDGIPDWGGESGPPPPVIELTSQPNRVILNWRGALSETGKDRLSGQRDFEGYKVYSARTNTSGDYALIAAWDIPDDYYRLTYEPGRGNWRQISYPLTIDGWKRALGDAEFDPRDYPRPSLINAYKDIIVDTVRDASGNIIRIVNTERLSYWAAQGPNHGNTYPDGGELHDNRIQRIEIRDTVIGDDTLSYGVYEMVMDNLNAAIPLWFSVTTLDYGDYKRNVEPLEGGTGANAVFAFPVYSADAVVDSGLKVTVYPNPYKIAFPDAQGRTTNYYAQGYEGYGLPAMNEHERRIWFANLPDTATIRIYSLDGDLIRTIEHPDKHLTRYSSIVGWDLISRNTQAVVSGIYIWRVDSRLGSQVGKIVIIK